MLTDEQINKLLEKHCYAPMPSAFEMCRAIEAAVRDELAKQEPLTWVIDVTTHGESTGRYEVAAREYWGEDFTIPLFAAPVVQPDDIRDAMRYRWLRAQHWGDSNLCVVKDPKDAVKLGRYCPSGGWLDAAIDDAMKERK